jgi:hypothetical protein
VNVEKAVFKVGFGTKPALPFITETKLATELVGTKLFTVVTDGPIIVGVGSSEVSNTRIIVSYRSDLLIFPEENHLRDSSCLDLCSSPLR